MSINRVYAKTHTAQADVLLEIIRSSNGEISRQEIAAVLGKQRLNKWDTALLDLLVTEGFVDIRRRESSSNSMILEYAYRYRTTEG